MLDRLLKRRWWMPAALARPPKLSISAAPQEEIDDAFLSRLRKVSLASQRRLTSGLTGEHPSPRRAHSLEFADYRSYSPGDDFRQVDWNAYLRLDHLFVKLADAPEQLNLQVALDASRSMAWGQPNKFTYARRVAIGLAYVALAHMDAANLFVLSGNECARLSQRHGATTTAALVRAIGALEPRGATDLDRALGNFASQRNLRGVGVLISDLLSPPGYQAGLERFSRSGLRPVVIHVLSPEELNPKLEGDVELQDVETGERLQISVDWNTLNRYRRWVRDWLSEIEAFCARRGITYVRVETTLPIEQLLLQRLRREKVLR